MAGVLAQFLLSKTTPRAAASKDKSTSGRKKRKVELKGPVEAAAQDVDESDEEDLPQEAAAAYHVLLEKLSKRRKRSASRHRSEQQPLKTLAATDKMLAQPANGVSKLPVETLTPNTIHEVHDKPHVVGATTVDDDQQGTCGDGEHEARAADEGGLEADAGGVNGADAGGMNGAEAGGVNGAEAGGVNGVEAGGVNGAEAGGVNGAEAGGVNGVEAGGVNGVEAEDKYDWEAHFRVELHTEQLAELKKPGLKFKELPHNPAVSGWGLPGRWLGAGGHTWPPVSNTLTACGVKERVCKCWSRVHEEETAGQAETTTALSAAPLPFVSEEQKVLFNLCNSYRDLFFPSHAYPSSSDHPDPLLDACLLHVVNHVARCADLIRKNNMRLEKEDGLVVRDQGFTRPKVLILMPMRNAAYTVGKRLLQLLVNQKGAGNIQGLAKFEEHFGISESDDEAEEDDATKGKGARHPKPADHQTLFRGNCDDQFRVGIKITRGAVRLGAPVLDSDVILASPLSLAAVLSEEGSTLDWLSSIEVLLMLRVDVLTMQNWAHVEAVMQAMNSLPKEQHNEDIMRVREPYLSGNSLHYRQTILLSSHVTPDMLSVFNRHAANHAGCLRWQPTFGGVLEGIVPLVQQRFHRLDIPKVHDNADVHWNHFTQQLWPSMRHTSGGLLIFIPHYFDFVRMRNFLIAEDASFAAISDYSKPAEIARARSRFFHQQRRVLLLTERAQFYHRLHIRGIQDLVFYGLPQHAEFYQEIFNMVDTTRAKAAGAAHATATCMFSKWDALALERIVGSKRTEKMLKGDTTLYMFC